MMTAPMPRAWLHAEAAFLAEIAEALLEIGVIGVFGALTFVALVFILVLHISRSLVLPEAGHHYLWLRERATSLSRNAQGHAVPWGAAPVPPIAKPSARTRSGR